MVWLVLENCESRIIVLWRADYDNIPVTVRYLAHCRDLDTIG